MATQSVAPPNVTDGIPQNQAVQPMINDQQDQDAYTGTATQSSIFVNKEPIREEQVQNAIKFLSHPKVKGSPVMYRRSFLEKKGLTKEEIDEAFRRVPDESPSLTTAQPAVRNQGGQSELSSNTQQVSPQSLQPTAVAPNPKVGTLTTSRFHWSHALLAVGVLAISGAATAVVFKNAIVPRLKSWIRKVVLEDEEEELAKKSSAKLALAEEAVAAAKAAAAAATDVARASQEMLVSKTEEKRYFGELMNLLHVQVQEMKSMSNSIRKLEGRNYVSGREDNRIQLTSSRPLYANGNADYDSHSARSLSPKPAYLESSTAQLHPKSYMEEINNLPPNPNQPVSNPLRSSWVPPQPPPVAMAEAAAVIRQPKKRAVRKEQQQLTEEQLVAPSAEVTDELQRVTNMSESGGVSDVNGGSSMTMNTSEIQREEDSSYSEA